MTHVVHENLYRRLSMASSRSQSGSQLRRL